MWAVSEKNVFENVYIYPRDKCIHILVQMEPFAVPPTYKVTDFCCMISVYT